MRWGEVLCYLNDSTAIIYIIFSHWLQNMRFLHCLFVSARLKGEIFSHLLLAIRPISSLNSRAKAGPFAAAWARDGERAFHCSSSPLSSMKKAASVRRTAVPLPAPLSANDTPHFLAFRRIDTRHQAPRQRCHCFERATRHVHLLPPSKAP